MSKKIFLSVLIIDSILIFSKCKIPYDPQIKNSKSQFLVVEGYINADGETSINLNRTRNIISGDTAAYKYELNAKVVIEDNFNDVFLLNENGNGNYSGFYFLNSNAQYRLHIKTSDKREYFSDFVAIKNSPSEEVGWNFNNGNVQVFVNANDPNNNTRFYRWIYSETWEFHSQYYSDIVYNPSDSTVIPRKVPVFVCYRARNSSNIILGSSAKLKEDIIHHAPIVLIPQHDNRISVLYSILVTQYALDSAGYNYWNAMKSNTENIGSIFDPQPNQTKGNIHCSSDSTETVIGYIGAGTTQQRRLFISHSSMPSGWNLDPDCTQYDVPNTRDSIVFYFGSGVLIPYLKDSIPFLKTKGFFSASPFCVDCTLTGSPVKPNFWP
jgi:hypothetical protein